MIKSLITSSFNELEFEPVAHKYTLHGKDMMPVSNVIKRFEEGFDTEQKSFEYALKHGLNQDDVKKMWKDNSDAACDFGHQTHDFGERYFYEKNLKPQNGHEQAIVKFWSEIPEHIIPVLCETRVYIKQLGYAGTFDLLLQNTLDGTAIIVDYKTNKDLFKNFRGKMLKAPFEFLLDTPYNHYQLQLSLYQIPLETIDVKVSERWVIWLRGDGTYSKYETYDYTDHLIPELN
jgi:hypothetical protein